MPSLYYYKNNDFCDYKKNNGLANIKELISANNIAKPSFFFKPKGVSFPKRKGLSKYNISNFSLFTQGLFSFKKKGLNALIIFCFSNFFFLFPKGFSFAKRKGLKGQWFLISSVIVAGMFLAIAGLFRNYTILDATDTPEKNIDYYFNEIKFNLYKINKYTKTGGTDCNIRDAVPEYISLAKSEMEKKGYILDVIPEYDDANCKIKNPSKLISLISERMQVWEGERPVLME